MTVLRDVRDSQGAPSPALLSWRSSHSDAAFGELGGQLLVSGQGPLHVGHVVLEALHLDCEVTLPCQFCLDRCCQSGNVLLLRCNDFRMVGLAVLFLLLGGHQLLQNANDLAALWCVPLTGTARQEKKKKSVERSSSENLVHGAFEPNGYVNRSRDMVSPAVYPRLSSHHFDIQSRHGLHYESHGYSRRSPALVLVLNFSPL